MKCLFVGVDGFTAWLEVVESLPPEWRIPARPPLSSEMFGRKVPYAFGEPRRFLRRPYVIEGDITKAEMAYVEIGAEAEGAVEPIELRRGVQRMGGGGVRGASRHLSEAPCARESGRGGRDRARHHARDDGGCVVRGA